MRSTSATGDFPSVLERVVSMKVVSVTEAARRLGVSVSRHAAYASASNRGPWLQAESQTRSANEPARKHRSGHAELGANGALVMPLRVDGLARLDPEWTRTDGGPRWVVRIVRWAGLAGAREGQAALSPMPVTEHQKFDS